jgi:hypothetical protein
VKVLDIEKVTRYILKVFVVLAAWLFALKEMFIIFSPDYKYLYIFLDHGSPVSICSG